MQFNPTCARHVFLRKDGLVLRSLRESDLDQIRTWRNKVRIRTGFFDSSEITEDKHRAWWRLYTTSNSDRSFVIFCQNTPIGFISLYNIDFIRGTAEIGRMMVGDDIFVGRGHMPKAIDLIAEYAQTIGIQQLYLDVKLENFAAIKCYQKASFSRVSSDAQSIRMTRSIKTPVKLSVTLYVRERIRTVKTFLESMNKNSCFEGHEVIIVADPEWVNPSDPCYSGTYEDGSCKSNQSLKSWFDKHESEFPRLSFKVVDDWGAETFYDRSRGQRCVNSCTGFNHAIRNGFAGDMVMTSMACDMYWAPFWDSNLTKWAGAADILIPRYVEIHAGRPTKPDVVYREGIGDFVFRNGLTEKHLLELLQKYTIKPGTAILESPRHRNWSHAIAMTMTAETFDKIGGFRELPYPESTDLFFDDDAGSIGALKLCCWDSFAVHGTVYVPDFVLSDDVNPNTCVEFRHDTRGGVFMATIEDRAKQRWMLKPREQIGKFDPNKSDGPFLLPTYPEPTTQNLL